MTYTITIARDYSEYSIWDERNNKVELSILPVATHLFTKDILDDDMCVVDSPIKREIIPAVLLLDKSLYSKGGKTYYKCSPNNKDYPIFLVGKKRTTQFNKHTENTYVLIKYKGWDAKHPEATLIETIGSVSSIANYTKFLMYCKQLVFTLPKWPGSDLRCLLAVSPLSCPICEDRTNREIITIDPVGSKDLDDAIGIKQAGNTTIISTYIANVSLLFHYLEAWKQKNDQVSTIYLSDKNIPMLPRSFSENIASLLERHERYALAADFTIKDNQIVDVQFMPCKITVHKNYVYEEPALLTNPTYKKILAHYPTHDSHEIVETMMKHTNYYAAKQLHAQQLGIYRTTTQPYKSNYVKYSEYNLRHEDLELDMYMHVTSPIRRVVDILNQMQLQRDFLPLTPAAQQFYDDWYNRLDYINEQQYAIRKVQNKSILMHALHESIDRTYEAEVIEIGENKYSVFIEALKLVYSLREAGRLELKEKIWVKIYVFWREHTQKIKLERIA